MLLVKKGFLKMTKKAPTGGFVGAVLFKAARREQLAIPQKVHRTSFRPCVTSLRQLSRQRKSSEMLYIKEELDNANSPSVGPKTYTPINKIIIYFFQKKSMPIKY